jgi:hypothetical protein
MSDEHREIFARFYPYVPAGLNRRASPAGVSHGLWQFRRRDSVYQNPSDTRTVFADLHDGQTGRVARWAFNFFEMPVVSASFLLAVYGTLAGIHVEHDAVGSVDHLRLSDHVAVHGHQPHEILLTGQQLGLEPMQSRCERSAAVPDLRRPDETNVGSAERRAASLRSSYPAKRL